MLNRHQALHILSEAGCSIDVIRHAKAVAGESIKIAKQVSETSNRIDIKLVEIGAILHDIGRSRTHDIEHGVKGAEILRIKELDEYVGFAENHIGAGITEREAEDLGLPKKDYMPRTLEEKIVTYADNLIQGDKVMSYEIALNELKEELGDDHPGVKRFESLHEEIRKLMNE